MERKCPGCGVEIQAKNVNDRPDGSVVFDCANCGIGLQDNAERTELRISKEAHALATTARRDRIAVTAAAAAKKANKKK